MQINAFTSIAYVKTYLKLQVVEELDNMAVDMPDFISELSVFTISHLLRTFSHQWRLFSLQKFQLVEEMDNVAVQVLDMPDFISELSVFTISHILRTFSHQWRLFSLQKFQLVEEIDNVAVQVLDMPDFISELSPADNQMLLGCLDLSLAQVTSTLINPSFLQENMCFLTLLHKTLKLLIS
jgi:sulfur relay (sulfurtransferase) DsrF/TusC family protein